MSDDVADVVFVPVVEITTGLEIGWNTNVSELLEPPVRHQGSDIGGGGVGGEQLDQPAHL